MRQAENQHPSGGTGRLLQSYLKPLSVLRLGFCGSLGDRWHGGLLFLSPHTVSALGDFASFGFFIPFSHNDTVRGS